MVWDLLDNIKQTRIHIIGIPKGEERERKEWRTYLKVKVKVKVT